MSELTLDTPRPAPGPGEVAVVYAGDYVNKLSGQRIERECLTRMERGCRALVINFRDTELVNSIGVSILPFDNPVRIAEDWAMVDVLSGGRVNFGVGRGYQPREFEVMRADPNESREVFLEALDEGLQWIIAGNVEEALRIAIDNHAQTWRGQEALLARIFRGSFIPSIWQGPHTQANGLGYGHLPDWQRNIDIQAEYRAIERRFPAEELVLQPRSLG